MPHDKKCSPSKVTQSFGSSSFRHRPSKVTQLLIPPNDNNNNINDDNMTCIIFYSDELSGENVNNDTTRSKAASVKPNNRTITI